jgi:aspartate racemase
MKTIGILGGMSNQATGEYYRMINEAVNERLGGWDIAETIIQGVNFGNIQYFIRNNKWEEAREYLEKKAIGARNAGADILICVSNTMHKVLDNISNVVDIPFLHISDPTGAAIVKAGLSKVGLIGTKPVMEADYISDRFRDGFNIEIVTPDEKDQVLVDSVIFDELVKGKIKAESKQAYIEVCRRMKDNGAQGVILGCTEIFLLIQQPDIPEMPLFNTTELHVKAVVDMALAEDT